MLLMRKRLIALIFIVIALTLILYSNQKQLALSRRALFTKKHDPKAHIVYMPSAITDNYKANANYCANPSVICANVSIFQLEELKNLVRGQGGNNPSSTVRELIEMRSELQVGETNCQVGGAGGLENETIWSSLAGGQDATGDILQDRLARCRQQPRPRRCHSRRGNEADLRPLKIGRCDEGRG